MVFEKIKEILAEQLDANADDMTMDTKIAEDLNADSLDVVELLAGMHAVPGVQDQNDNDAGHTGQDHIPQPVQKQLRSRKL